MSHSSQGSEQQPSDVAPKGASLKVRAIRGAAWTLGTFAVINVLKLGSNLILTRLLYPEAFGLLSLVMTFLQGLQMFSDVGIGLSVVQNERGEEPRFLNSVWTLQIIRGGILWLLCWAIAWPLASFYGQESLLLLIPAVGITVFIAGFDSTAIHTAQRNLQLKKVGLLDVLSSAIGSGTTILLAYAHRSAFGAEHPGAVWAMVVGMVVGSLVRTLLSHKVFRNGPPHRFALDRESVDAILKLGRWIFVSSALTFLVGQSDRLIFAKLIPLDLFGVYGIAAMLAALPLLGIGHVARSVAFPVYSRMSTTSPEFKGVFARTRRPLLFGGATLVSGLMACGPLLTRILYDSRYEQAGWILQLLCVGTWFQLLETGNSTLLLAQGRTNWLAGGNAAKLACMVALVPVGYHLAGFRGALTGVVASELAKYLVSELALVARGLVTFGADLTFTVLVAASAASGIFAADTLRTWGYGTVPAFFAAGVTTATIWGALTLGIWSVERARRRAASPTFTPSGSA